MINSKSLNKILKNFWSDKRLYSSRTDSVLKGFTAAVGNTPLIKLERISKEAGCDILVKCEYMNPGGN